MYELPGAIQPVGAGWLKVSCVVREEALPLILQAQNRIEEAFDRRHPNPTVFNGIVLEMALLELTNGMVSREFVAAVLAYAALMNVTVAPPEEVPDDF